MKMLTFMFVCDFNLLVVVGKTNKLKLKCSNY